MLRRLYQAAANRSGRQGIVLILVLAVALAGVVAIVVAVNSQKSAPEPSRSARGHISDITQPSQPPTTASTTPPGGHQPEHPAHQPPPLAASAPTTIDIPAIDVHSSVIAIGTTADGTLAVPQPGPDLDKAAWFDKSVTPGQDGPSVIEGHIDTVYGPSVFFDLGALELGDTIRIARADGSRTVFAVNAVRSYPSHDAFPTDTVYGADLAHPTLRLITCSNFDESIGHYVGNTVVFAHLIVVHHAHVTSAG